MEILISLVLLVFGVLQIVLFFKVWGMCNNVKKISYKFKAFSNKDFELDKALLKGNKDLAIKLLTETAFDEYLDIIYNDLGFDNNSNLQFAIEKYARIFKELGVEMPKQLKNIRTADDINAWKENKYKI